MKRFNVVLLGALLWFAWYLGTLSAPNMATHSTSHDHLARWKEHQGSPDSGAPGLQRFAVESEHFLGRSAHTLEEDSGQLWNRLESHERDDHKYPASPQTPIVAIQTHLAMAWHQVAPVWHQLQPAAQSGWSAIQAGWRQWAASMAKNGNAADTAVDASVMPSSKTWRSHHPHHRYYRAPQTADAESPDWVQAQ